MVGLLLTLLTAAEPIRAAAPIPRGWIAVGVGAAVMVAGGVLYGFARADEMGDARRAKELSGIFLLGAGLGAGTAALHWALGPGARQAVWGPLAAGGALLAAGAVLYLLARLDAASSAARTEEPLGLGLLGIGTGALVSSALLLLFGVEAPGAVSVSAGPHGAGLVFSTAL